MTRLIALLALLLTLPALAAEPVKLTIFHTNDIHGYALPEQATWVKVRPQPLIGGFLALENALRQERAKAGHSLLLDAGDILTGQVASTFERGGAQGGYLIEAMNLLGFDATCVGNHEFDAGLANLDKMIAMAKFPFLAANLVDTRETKLATIPYKVFTRGPLKIAVIGAVSPRYKQDIPPSLLKGFEVPPMAEAIKPIVDKLRPEVHVVILLTHAGLDADKALAKQVSGVDVIVGGHSHTRLQQPVLESEILIVQAGCYLRQLGILELSVDVEARKVVAHRGRLRPLWAAEATQPSAELRALIGEVAAKADTLMKEQVGALAAPLTRNYYGESAMGDFVAKAFRVVGKADIGMINSGGLRTNLDKGQVSRGQLMAVLPFGNRLCRFTLTGAQLRQLLLANARASAGESHGILQVSGVRYRWQRKGEQDAELLDVTVGGEPLDPQGSYTIVTNTYVGVAQPKKYMGFAPTGVTTLAQTDLDAALAYFAAAEGPIDARLEGNIVEVGGKE